jgi:hypothetical protein
MIFEAKLFLSMNSKHHTNLAISTTSQVRKVGPVPACNATRKLMENKYF